VRPSAVNIDHDMTWWIKQGILPLKVECLLHWKTMGPHMRPVVTVTVIIIVIYFIHRNFARNAIGILSRKKSSMILPPAKSDNENLFRGNAFPTSSPVTDLWVNSPWGLPTVHGAWIEQSFGIELWYTYGLKVVANYSLCHIRADSNKSYNIIYCWDSVDNPW